VDQPSFFLGENVLVHYCLKNSSAATIQITLGTAHQRFKVTATDERGTAVPSQSPFDFDELIVPSTIRPGGQWCHSVSLLQYAQIERAGAYIIGVAYDSSSLPNNLDSVPETRTSITFVMPSPDEAESVVAAMESRKERPIVVTGKISPPYQDFSVMRCGIYLPPLLRRIRAGNIAAIEGIRVIPTPDATRALIDLTQDLRPEVVRRAAGALTWRLPPALGGTLGTLGGFGSYPTLAAASWRPEFGPDARATARKLLTWPDEWDIRAGAFTTAAVGEVDDAPAVSASLSSNVSRRGVMQELTRAAEGLVGRGYVPPAPNDDAVGDMTIWLVALGRGARPSGWEDVAGRALNHAVSYVREAALNRIPVPVPESLIPVIRKTFDSRDPNEQGAACRFATRSKLAELRGAAMDVFEKSTDTMTLNDAANAVAVLGTREEYVAAFVDRLADPQSHVPDSWPSAEFVRWNKRVWRLNRHFGTRSARTFQEMENVRGPASSGHRVRPQDFFGRRFGSGRSRSSRPDNSSNWKTRLAPIAVPKEAILNLPKNGYFQHRVADIHAFTTGTQPAMG
jgi:hypothetical protein